MSAYTKSISKAKSLHQKYEQKMRRQRKILSHPAVKETFESIPLRLRKKVVVSLSTHRNSVLMCIYLRDLTSFKDPVLTKLIEPFIDWTTYVNEFTHDLPNKDFSFTREFGNGEDAFDISVLVYAYVKHDSPTCRVVVTEVTEEVVRVETKKIICE